MAQVLFFETLQVKCIYSNDCFEQIKPTLQLLVAFTAKMYNNV